MNKFEESKHDRDEKGQFSGSGSSSSKSDKKKLLERMKKKHPYYSSDRKMTTTGKTVDKKTAKSEVKKMRAEGTFASLFHVGGPATGPKSEYAIVYPEKDEKKENCLDIYHEEEIQRGRERYGKSNSLSTGKKPSDFNKKDLEEGTEVEMEHTSDRKVAQRIAMDHLTEDRDYYTKLRKMEK